MCLRPISRYVDLKAFALALIAILLSNSFEVQTTSTRMSDLLCPSVPSWCESRQVRARHRQTLLPLCFCKDLSLSLFLSLYLLAGVLRSRKWKHCHQGCPDECCSRRSLPRGDPLASPSEHCAEGGRLISPSYTFYFDIMLILFLSRVLSFGEGISERISDTVDINY